MTASAGWCLPGGRTTRRATPPDAVLPPRIDAGSGISNRIQRHIRLECHAVAKMLQEIVVDCGRASIPPIAAPTSRSGRRAPAWTCRKARLGSPSAASSNGPRGPSEPLGSYAQTRQGRAAPGPASLRAFLGHTASRSNVRPGYAPYSMCGMQTRQSRKPSEYWIPKASLWRSLRQSLNLACLAGQSKRTATPSTTPRSRRAAPGPGSSASPSRPAR